MNAYEYGHSVYSAGVKNFVGPDLWVWPDELLSQQYLYVEGYLSVLFFCHRGHSLRSQIAGFWLTYIFFLLTSAFLCRAAAQDRDWCLQNG